MPEISVRTASASISTVVLYTACGMFLYAICAGFRDNFGIMLPCIAAERSLSYSTVSFIIALGQLFFGLMQPLFGYLSIRKSARFVFLCGILMMLAGLISSAVTHSAALLTIAMGILLPSGTAAASFGIIISCLAPVLSEDQSRTASGFIATGIGLNICILAPVLHSVLAAQGLRAAMFFLSCPILLLVPITLVLTRRRNSSAASAAPDHVQSDAEEKKSFRRILAEGFASSDYWRLSFGFYTCGFHMALIQTHLFSQLTSFGISPELASWGLSVYGLGVIVGCLGSGMACRRFPPGKILGVLYSSRCLWVLFLLLPMPPVLLFAVILMLGLTGVATVAPTSNITGSIFGPRRLATLFGFTYLLHQIGAFCSAWFGGLCLKLTGSYSGIWYADILLCLAAGIVCFGIRHRN